LLVEARAFRDALRTDPELRARDAARKRTILAVGITAGADYAETKSTFVVAVLEGLGLR
jgi:GrpB-like predicted nucleotidyltransferase (UPF0157 family)